MRIIIMAISDTELNNRITAAFQDYNRNGYKDEKNSPKHLKILGDAMKAYFEEKTEIAYGWSAVLPPPASTPDPVAKFDSAVKFPAFDLTPSANLTTLAALIQAAVLSGVIQHAAGFTVTPGSFLAVTQLVLVTQAQHGNTVFYNSIVKPTCAWYLKCINPAPLAGQHGSYSGATTGMSIK
jgi:hypothetical protein